MTSNALQFPPHLQPLDDELRTRFGPYRDHAWLCLLVALTGRTRYPVSARMVVSSVDVQHDVVAFITEVLGHESVAHFTRVTEAGLLALQNETSQLTCICLDGIPTDLNACDVLYRAVGHRPAHVLQCSPRGEAQGQSIARNVAWLIVRGDAWSDPDTLSRLVTVRFDLSKEATAHRARYRLGAEPRADVDFSSIFEVDWSSPISRPTGMKAVADRVTQQEEIDRIEIALSLASVWTRLAADPHVPSSALTITPDTLDTVLALLAKVKAPADRTVLSRPAADCLRVLQGCRDWLMQQQQASEPKSGAKHRLARDGSDHTCGPFTYYRFLQSAGFGAFSADAVRNWFKRLEDTGLLEECAKQGRKKTFDLTDAGRAWKPGILAEDLRVLLNPVINSPNSEKQSFGLHSPAVGDLSSE